ncbi:ATP-binding cassette domain-containing protein [Pseudonocardia sp. ICBG162]|uniref:ATP-binding cassette domain-containing protein n=1 Tax=Pseudonocardia sp. ICBG162 TaxID=2846761 RepID=UPI001CF69981|nr:ATP-binding cassette domain-containing protein [Pseudonocardia sp. ICBG162]
MTEHVLRTVGLGKSYRRRRALDGLDLELPRGKIAALVGPNGAGKTTLLMLATGLLAPTAGTIEVLGTNPAHSGMPAGLSFLAQGKPLYPRFTVAEMLRAAATLNAGTWDAAYAARLVAAAELADDQRIGDLSAGQRARVAVAIALGRRPELLLLDEPLAELDPLARTRVLGTLLAEVTETGMTVLMSSHILTEVEDAADHLFLLRDGRLQLDGDLPILLDEHRVLVGPATDAPTDPGVVHASTSGRQLTTLVRGGDKWVGFDSARPTFDQLVLGYIQAPATTPAGVA